MGILKHLRRKIDKQDNVGGATQTTTTPTTPTHADPVAEEEGPPPLLRVQRSAHVDALVKALREQEGLGSSGGDEVDEEDGEGQPPRRAGHAHSAPTSPTRYAFFFVFLGGGCIVNIDACVDGDVDRYGVQQPSPTPNTHSAKSMMDMLTTLQSNAPLSVPPTPPLTPLAHPHPPSTISPSSHPILSPAPPNQPSTSHQHHLRPAQPKRIPHNNNTPFSSANTDKKHRRVASVPDSLNTYSSGYTTHPGGPSQHTMERGVHPHHTAAGDTVRAPPPLSTPSRAMGAEIAPEITPEIIPEEGITHGALLSPPRLGAGGMSVPTSPSMRSRGLSGNPGPYPVPGPSYASMGGGALSPGPPSGAPSAGASSSLSSSGVVMSTPVSPSGSQRIPLYIQLLSQALQRALVGDGGAPSRLPRQLLTRDEVQSACIDMVVYAMKLGAAGEGEFGGGGPGSPGVQTRARERARLQAEVFVCGGVGALCI